MLKKIVTAAIIAASTVACAGVGGKEITDANSRYIILQSVQAVHNKIAGEFEKAMYEENYALDSTGSVLNLKYSTSCGLTVTERIAYEADLSKWKLTADIYPDEKKSGITDIRLCDIIINGKVKGYVAKKKWSAPGGTVDMIKTGFSHRDSDGLTLTVVDTLSGNKVLWSGEVFPAMEISTSTGNTGGNFYPEFKVNGEEYEGTAVVWEKFWAAFPFSF